MCMSCGCGSPNDDHGDSRNLTLNDIDQAAMAAGTTRDKVLQNIAGNGQQNMSDGSQNQQNNSDSSQTADSTQRFRSAESQYDQPVMQTGYDQQQQQQGKVLQGGDQQVPGQTVQTPGTQSGGAWSQGEDQTNYQPPDRETPSH